MRDGWRATTLGEVATLEYGKGLTERDRDGHGWPVYGSAGVVGHHSTPLVDRAPVIIVGRKGTAGSIHWSDTPCWPIDTTYFVKPLARCEPRYLFLALESAGLQDLCAQTGVPGLNRERAYQAELLLPPLDGQRRIVDLIAAVDEEIGMAERISTTALNVYNSCARSQLTRARATAPLLRLGDLSMSRLGKMLSGQSRTGPEGHPYLRNADVQWDLVKLDNLARMDFSPAEQVEFALKAGDVMICEGGEVGRAAVLDHDVPGVFFQKAIHRVRCGERLLPRFLMHYLRYCAANDLLGDLVTAQTIAHLTGEKLRLLKIPALGIDDQVATVALLDSAITLARQADNLAQTTRAVRLALLSELLSGNHEIPASYDEVMA